ncbi:MAG: outer membrane protein assembly factor BamE [Mariprofundus sp.]|nr:outer membrane protein assembly factor BamE [Mariprofundus sp.]
MRALFMLTILSTGLLLAACLHEPIHQGNRLDNNNIYLIQTGDSKFSIEQKLGSPALNNILHPKRVTYYEEFEDEDSGKILWRYVEIVYDDALRAQKITRTGFEEKK